MRRIVGKSGQGSPEHAARDRNQLRLMTLKMQLQRSISHGQLTRRKCVGFESTCNLRQLWNARGPWIELLQQSGGSDGAAQNALKPIDVQIGGMQCKRPCAGWL